MNLLVWSRPEGENFPLLHKWHHTWARKFLGQGRGCCSSAHVQGMREQHSLWAPPWAVVLETRQGGEAPELWYLQGISGRQSIALWCHGRTWTKSSHGQFDYWVIHSSQANFHIELEVRNCPSTWLWAAQTKRWAASICLHWYLLAKAETSQLLHRFCSPQQLGAGLGYSSSRGISTDAVTSCILPSQREWKHWSSRHILHTKFWYSSVCQQVTFSTLLSCRCNQQILAGRSWNLRL